MRCLVVWSHAGPFYYIKLSVKSIYGLLWTWNSCQICLLQKEICCLSHSTCTWTDWFWKMLWRDCVYTSWMWLTFQLTAQNIQQGVQSNYTLSSSQKGGAGICFPNHSGLCLLRVWGNSHIFIIIQWIYRNALGSERPNTCKCSRPDWTRF